MSQGYQPKKIKSIGAPPKSGSSVEKSNLNDDRNMKLTQYDQEDYQTYYILRGLNAHTMYTRFEVEFDTYPSNETIKQITKDRNNLSYPIDTIEIEEVKSKITRFIVDED